MCSWNFIDEVQFNHDAFFHQLYHIQDDFFLHYFTDFTDSAFCILVSISVARFL